MTECIRFTNRNQRLRQTDVFGEAGHAVDIFSSTLFCKMNVRLEQTAKARVSSGAQDFDANITVS